MLYDPTRQGAVTQPTSRDFYRPQLPGGAPQFPGSPPMASPPPTPPTMPWGGALPTQPTGGVPGSTYGLDSGTLTGLATGTNAGTFGSLYGGALANKPHTDASIIGPPKTLPAPMGDTLWGGGFSAGPGQVGTNPHDPRFGAGGFNTTLWNPDVPKQIIQNSPFAPYDEWFRFPENIYAPISPGPNRPRPPRGPAVGIPTATNPGRSNPTYSTGGTGY